MGISLNDLSPKAREQVAAKIQAQHKVSLEQAKNKYRNIKTPVKTESENTIVFDSKKEAERFSQLCLLEKAGAIRNLRLQVEYTLQERYITPDGDLVRAIKYRADFTYERQTKPDAYGHTVWLLEVEDVKGKRTDEYKIKKKLMQEKFGITIKEV